MNAIQKAIALLRNPPVGSEDLHDNFSVADELEAILKQEPVAVIGPVYQLFYAGEDSIVEIVQRHELKIGSKLYAAPVSAEPVNARLLELLRECFEDTKTVLRMMVQNPSEYTDTQRSQYQDLVDHVRKELKSAAEQAKPAPELTDERIIEIGYQSGLGYIAEITDDDQWNNVEPKLFKFARTIERELRGEGK